MKRSYIGLALGALVAVGAVLSLPSCGHDQKLVSIAVQPQSFTFLGNVIGVNHDISRLTVRTFIHPRNKDITTQVTWNADVPEVITVASGAAAGGTVTTQGSCGVSDVSATAPEGTGGAANIIVGYGSVTVNDPNNPNCPGGSKQQAVGGRDPSRNRPGNGDEHTGWGHLPGPLRRGLPGREPGRSQRYAQHRWSCFCKLGWVHSWEPGDLMQSHGAARRHSRDGNFQLKGDILRSLPLLVSQQLA